MCAAFLGLRSGDSYAAPITFNTALPVSQEEFIFRELVTLAKASDNFGDLGREMTVVTVNSVLVYRPGRRCPTDPVLAQKCAAADRWNKRLVWGSGSIWVLGFAAAYLTLPVLE